MKRLSAVTLTEQLRRNAVELQLATELQHDGRARAGIGVRDPPGFVLTHGGWRMRRGKQ